MIFFWTAFLSLLPISELRGGIPFAMTHGVPWFAAWPFAAAVNALAAPICWIFLSTVHKFFYGTNESSGLKGFAWYRNFFDRFIENARKKLEGGVQKWGAFGIALFVAIPLPITGAWTGTLGAWVLGLPKRKTFPAVMLGVAVAGGIVTSVMLLGIEALTIFIKK
jgi:uncharacterized membrane protein